MIDTQVKANSSFSPDQWSVYLDYITSLFKLIDEQRSSDSHNNCHDAGDIAGSSVSEARTFFNQLKKPTVRGPYLAEIELKCRMLARREDDDGGEKKSAPWSGPQIWLIGVLKIERSLRSHGHILKNLLLQFGWWICWFHTLKHLVRSP